MMIEIKPMNKGVPLRLGRQEAAKLGGLER